MPSTSCLFKTPRIVTVDRRQLQSGRCSARFIHEPARYDFPVSQSLANPEKAPPGSIQSDDSSWFVRIVTHEDPLAMPYPGRIGWAQLNERQMLQRAFRRQQQRIECRVALQSRGFQTVHGPHS
jgi:hypothetical protein